MWPASLLFWDLTLRLIELGRLIVVMGCVGGEDYTSYMGSVTLFAQVSTVYAYQGV